MSNPSLHIHEENLSVAWGKAVLRVLDSGVNEIVPLIVTVDGFNKNGEVQSIPEIQGALDAVLSSSGKQSCETVASTIFPRSMWNPKRDRHALYGRYNDIAPQLKRHRGNQFGIYFQRMIAYGDKQSPLNQLEHIISTWKRGNHRRSALQASIFDPNKDHNHARQRGFPCLQHVTFSKQENGGLCVTGFYATQFLIERAYGNYLGLCRLGKFMAHEMGLPLTRMTCFTGVAMCDFPKRKLNKLAKTLSGIASSTEPR